MASWGISPLAEEKEQVKEEYAGFLGGINAVGEIPWATYSELFDIGMDLLDRMYELGKSEVNAMRTKVFSKDFYISLYPKHSENEYIMYWLNECDGKTEDECNELGYMLDVSWFK